MARVKGTASSLILGRSDLRGEFCQRQNSKPLKCYALPDNIDPNIYGDLQHLHYVTAFFG
jgi:hypothetical protein